MRLFNTIIALLVGINSFAQVTENFSDGDFTSNPTWSGDAAEFTVNTSNQLQLNATVAGASYLSTAATFTSLNNMEWRCYVKQTFPPSSSNYGRVYLASDQANLEGPLNGYYLQFGEALGNDAVELFQQTGTTSTSICRGTNAQIAASFTVGVKVTRDAAGLWNLYVDAAGGTNYVLGGSGTNTTYNASQFAGFATVYTVGNITKFFYDDFTIAPIVVDVTPPTIVSNTIISSTQLDVLFNEAVQLGTAQTITNYSANNGLGNPSLATRDASNLALVHLTFATPFGNSVANTLTVTNVEDAFANAITTATTSFTYVAPVVLGYKDLIINEIYADPSPVVNLTAAEFIEIYNRSSNTYNLNGVKFSDVLTGTGATFGSYVLNPNEYVIICPSADVAQFTALSYTNVLGVSSFPSLNNTGDNLYLKSSTGVVVDSVNYLDTWYQDAVKKNGGWTLELINPNLNASCNQTTNWIASTDIDGGTPGFLNSVYSIAPDLVGPTIVSATIIDASHITVCLDDVVSATQLTTTINYVITGGIGSPTSATATSGNMCATLALPSNMINNTTYTITISGITDCSGNAVSPNTIAFTYTADVTAPQLVSSSVISTTQLDVQFNEAMDVTTAQTVTNYIANNGLGNPSSAVRDASALGLVHLTFATPFTNAVVNTLTISGVQDVSLNTIVTTTLNFTYFVPVIAGYKDIVINEIMADPTPVVGLPNAEFVELYNRSSNAINLIGLTLSGSLSSGGATLPNYNLAPNSYVIICSATTASSFAAYPNTIGVSSFPSLTNSGASLFLKSSTSVIIDSVTYADTWYNNTTKKDGGWTLEQINPNINATCLQATNWTASSDANGGTPGTINSVYNTAPDLVGPKISGVSVIDSLHVNVCFNDGIAAAQLNNNLNYAINNAIGTPVSAVADAAGKCVVLTLATKLINATNYTITITGVTDCNANALTPNTKQFSFYKAQPYDVVINELMPDPDPAQSLPAEEYVEFRNRTNFNINLKDWTFSSLTTTATLPDITIAPNGYLVIAATGAANVFYNNFGIVVYDVASFPSLLNSGTTISLNDNNNKVINAITYATSWYNDASKTGGGFSMEMIDPNNPCGGQSNWHASTDGNGGTPGFINSVNASNPDNTSPQLVRVNVLSADTIALVFTEALDLATLTNPLNYTFDNGLTAPTFINPIAPDYTKVILKVSSSLQIGVMYNVTVLSNIKDCVGNPLINGTAPFALPQKALPNDVVINEVLPDPTTGGVEFVEIYNRSNKTIDLKYLRIGSMDTLTNNLIYTEVITEEGYLLFPETYLVLSENAAIVKQQYQTPNPKGFLDIATLPSMSIDADVVTLSTDSGVVIDNLKYTSKMHFPLLVSTKGVSLERIDFNRPTDDRTNWNSAAEGVGFATPAYRNSQYLQADGGSGVTITNPLFSPDNDGYNDVLNISYKLDETGKAGNVFIYDSKGRLVSHLIKNQQLAQDGVISWNGINDDNEKAPIGIYIVYVELFNLSGKTSKFKLTCTLAGKL